MRCEAVVRGLPRGLVPGGWWLTSPSEAPELVAPKREASDFIGQQAAPDLSRQPGREER